MSAGPPELLDSYYRIYYFCWICRRHYHTHFEPLHPSQPSPGVVYRCDISTRCSFPDCPNELRYLHDENLYGEQFLLGQQAAMQTGGQIRLGSEVPHLYADWAPETQLARLPQTHPFSEYNSYQPQVQMPSIYLPHGNSTFSGQSMVSSSAHNYFNSGYEYDINPISPTIFGPRTNSVAAPSIRAGYGTNTARGYGLSDPQLNMSRSEIFTGVLGSSSNAPSNDIWEDDQVGASSERRVLVLNPPFEETPEMYANYRRRLARLQRGILHSPEPRESGMTQPDEFEFRRTEDDILQQRPLPQQVKNSSLSGTDVATQQGMDTSIRESREASERGLQVQRDR